MRHCTILLFMLICSSTLFSQLITIKVLQSYPYTYSPEFTTVAIVENANFGVANKSDENIRTSEFESKTNEVYTYLKGNGITYRVIPQKPYDPSLFSSSAVVLNRIDLEISTSREQIKDLRTFTETNTDLSFQNQDQFISLDDSFMKECMDQLTEEAREKAEKFAVSLNKKTSDVHEIKVIKHLVSKRYKKSALLAKGMEDATHSAVFEVEISFETIAK